MTLAKLLRTCLTNQTVCYQGLVCWWRQQRRQVTGRSDEQGHVVCQQGAFIRIANQHFDQAGSQGDKQDAITKAKETVAKLYIKHQINSAIGGGGSSSLNGLLTKMI